MNRFHFPFAIFAAIAGAQCNGNSLNRIICDPGSVECTETGARICNPAGTAIIDGDCPDGTACVDGEPDACLDVICEPGERVCDANNVYVMECDGTGTTRCAVQNCAASPRDGVCDRGECVAVCAAGQKSNLGCEYFAADLDNATIDCDGAPGGAFCDAAGSQFAVVVSNPDPQQVAFVIVTSGVVTGGTIDPATCDTNPEPPEKFVDAQRIPPRGIQIFDLPPRNINGTTKEELAYRVASNIPVTVYQFNPLENVDVFSNDASMLIPTTAADTTYLAMSRPQVNPQLRGFVTVVGIDSQPTEVTVRASAPTAGGSGGIPALSPGESYTTTLNRFEVLNIETTTRGGDLTGTRIEADRPVVAYSGHEGAVAPDLTCNLVTQTCAFSPTTACGGNPTNPGDECSAESVCCADHLEQQLFPISSWGREYLAVGSWRRGDEQDAWRVMASQDDTDIVLDPPVAVVPTLDAGQWHEFEADADFFLTATKPVLVGQFLQGEHAPNPGVQAGDAGTGDPAFMLVAPVRQLRNSYVFLAPDKYEDDFVVIGVPMGESVRIDGDDARDTNAFPLAQVSGAIGGSGWQSIRTKISDGFHTVECDTSCSIMVHGFDSFVSYGYPGGLNLLECSVDADCPAERPNCNANAACEAVGGP